LQAGEYKGGRAIPTTDPAAFYPQYENELPQ
jgi:hypothetical protein